MPKLLQYSHSNMDYNNIQQLRKTIQEEMDKREQENQFKVVRIPSHVHNGVDSQHVSFTNLDDRFFTMSYTLSGTAPATAANYSSFFITPYPVLLKAAYEVHTTAGSDVGAVTLNIEKLTNTTAPGGGTNLFATALSLKATANTVQTATLTTPLSSLNLNTGDRLALVLSGTPTAVANMTVTLVFGF